ncbi:MAG: preprotein translocase subunit YajC [Clostridia bacterium]|nr:preprotein translocase subunit YajC [Clostridia bacterium]
MNFICAENGNAGSIVIYVVLIVAMLALLIMPYFTQKKKSQEFAKMLEAMKVGDLVKTAGGIIGRITKITDKGDIKTVILETGSKTEKSYMEFDMAMIYCVLKSTKVEETEEVETVENAAEETLPTAEVKEDVKAEEKAEEKPKKTAAKKTTAKKTTAKKTTKK